jgi:hypothetical protein
MCSHFVKIIGQAASVINKVPHLNSIPPYLTVNLQEAISV